MASPTPTLDAATRAALDKLADIAVPPPVSWVPQTWAWAALAVAVLATGAWMYIRWRRQREANRYRVAALAALAKLEAQLDDDARRPQALAAMPVLLKRVALAAWPRPQVASLAGARWVAFLRIHADGAGLSDAVAQLLDDMEYRSTTALTHITLADARACLRAVRSWIEAHRVST